MPCNSATCRTSLAPRQATSNPSKAGAGSAAEAAKTWTAAVRPSASARARSPASGPARSSASAAAGSVIGSSAAIRCRHRRPQPVHLAQREQPAQLPPDAGADQPEAAHRHRQRQPA
jgi:hypothetical protein